MGFYRISEPDYDTGESLFTLAEIVVDPEDHTVVRDIRGEGVVADMLRKAWTNDSENTPRLLGGFGMKAIEYVEDPAVLEKAHWRLINERDGQVTAVIHTTDGDYPLLADYEGENPPIGFQQGMPLQEYLAQATQFVIEPVNEVAEQIAEPHHHDLPEVIRATGDAIASVIEAHGTISKLDEDKRLAFGWAYVTHDKDGQVAVDKSGEFVDDYEEIEKAAYNFVIKSRAGDADHSNVQVSDMVESMVFTPDKIKKMGLPEGVLPTGWWVGFRINDDELWKSVKDGKRLAFSVHGKGTKKQVDD